MRQRIESALSFIGADHRETWVICAMGVKSELGEDGFELWNQWSQQSQSYSAQAARSVWKSIKGGATTIGSVFHEARANGWKDDSQHVRPSAEQLRARHAAVAERLTADGVAKEAAQREAAQKADWIMKQSKPEMHAYLRSKGWPDAKGAVWWPDPKVNLLCIPMRVSNHLVGLQMIDREGGKKFLAGQRPSEAEHVMQSNGHAAKDWFCEGYATGCTLRDCLAAMKISYRIHIAFSAGNLVKITKGYEDGYVIADNDESGTGEHAAQQTGLPYYLPPKGDLNDLHKAQGVFKTSQALKFWLMKKRDTVP